MAHRMPPLGVPLDFAVEMAWNHFNDRKLLQMELIGHDFFVFVNADSEDVCVIYKRRDGNYGLIEPAWDGDG